MRSKPWLAAALALGLLAPAAAPAFADQASTNTGAASSDAKAPPAHGEDEIICKREEVTGSRLGGHKECHPRRVWEQISADARDEVDRNENTGFHCAMGQSSC